MAELEFDMEMLGTQQQLSKEFANRDRIAKHARETNDQTLAWAIVDECNMIMSRFELKAGVLGGLR